MPVSCLQGCATPVQETWTLKTTALNAFCLILTLMLIHVIFLSRFFANYDLLSTFAITSKKDGLNKKITIILTGQNRPLKPQYLNANNSFEKGVVPEAMKGWVPSNDSYKYFQHVDGKDVWIYSVFYVDNITTNSNRAMIVGIGMARIPVNRIAQCVLHMDNEGKRFVRARGRVQLLQDHHKTMVRPMKFTCLIPPNIRPIRVSFSTKYTYTFTNSFKIQYPSSRTYNFTVCYSALHSNFSNIHQLLWSFEMNQILGAEHFFLYNFSISSTTSQVLEYYGQKGLVTVLQWPLPTIETWYLAQVLSINDCLYRNRNTSKYVAFLDSDELILPKLHSTWNDMMDAINKNSTVAKEMSPFIKLKSKLNSKFTENGRNVALLDEQETITGPTTVVTDAVNYFKSSNTFMGKMKPKRYKRYSKLKSRTTKTKKSTLARTTNNPSPVPIVMSSSNNLRSSETTKSNTISVSPSYSSKNNFEVPPIASYSFRCVFLNWKRKSNWNKIMKKYRISKTDEQFIRSREINPLLQYFQLDQVFPHQVRSKLIVRPELIKTMGIHFPHEFYFKSKPFYVSPSFANLHHYRNYKPEESTTISFIIFRYITPLLQKLRHRYKDLQFEPS